MPSRITKLLLALGLAGLIAACVPADSRPVRVPGATTFLLGAHNDTTTPFNLVSMPALIEHRYDGRGLRLTRVLARELTYTRYAVTYRSGDLTIGGVMNVPNRPGRHPVVVIAHGYGDPRLYTSGGMLGREQAYLSDNGFVAFQIDYRNYARSTRESARPVAHPLGYPADLVDAVRALRRAHLSFVDDDRVSLFGRSMGGGVVLDALAARPHLARAAVLYSPVSSLASDNYERWVQANPPLRARVVAAYGTPASRPGVWRAASARAYLQRVDVPVRVEHGTADVMCPVRWSEATVAALRADGEDASLREYPGEGHRFGRSWSAMMHDAVEFLRAELA